MTTLLSVALGPVQEFIARARRMRDLWFGSHLLSELSRAAAASLAKDRFTLVFPALAAGHRELEPCVGMWRDRGEPPQAIANKILAYHDDLDCEAAYAAAGRARVAALACWRDLFARRALDRGAALLRKLPSDSLAYPTRVIDDLLEFYAACVAYDPTSERGYDQARDEIERAVVARKRLRDFGPWAGEPGFPKSSLDGFRESILIDLRREHNPPIEAVHTARQFRIEPGREHLDGVGFVKRLGGEPDHFVPLTRVAFGPWVDAVVARAAAPGAGRLSRAWLDLVQACDSAPRLAPSGAPIRWLRESPFRWDAELFLRGQWPRIDEELDASGFCANAAGPVLDALHGEPHPYVACLCADGDGVGTALDQLHDPTAHRLVSERLTAFARGARELVESHHGLLVYSGGDDVLAFLPVGQAVACAAALRERFLEHAHTAFAGAPVVPTLSVGIGIGHVMSSLADLLELGRAAEALAKRGSADVEADDDERGDTDKDALAVIVDKRAGAQRGWRRRWPHAPAAFLSALVRGFETGAIPGGLPAEIEDLLRRLPGIDDPELRDSPDWAATLATQVQMIVERKRDRRGQPVSLAATGLDLDVARFADTRRQVRAWTDACAVARMIADANKAVARARDHRVAPANALAEEPQP